MPSRRSNAAFIRISLLLAAIVLFVVPAPAAEPLRVCLVSGSIEYKSNDSLADFQKFLESNYDARCARAFVQGTDEEHLPGLENLDQCDVMLLFTRRLKLSGDELERFKRYCTSGKPIVGVRTASHAIQTWLDLDKEVLGGDYQGHYGPDLVTKTSFTDAGRRHPIFAGFEPFDSAGSLYKNPQLADDVQVLLTGSVTDAAGAAHSDPVAWTREFKGAHIFYTSLGHPDDFANPGFRKMLAQSLFWTAKRDLK